MDKLKKYLLRHRADLDVDSPADDSWGQIESKIPDGSHPTGFATASEVPTRSGFSKRMVRYAAAACLILLAGVGLWLVIENSKTPSDIAQHNSGITKSKSVPGKEKIEIPPRKEEKAETSPAKEEKLPGELTARNMPKPNQAHQKAKASKPEELPDEIDVIDKSYSHLIDYQLKKLRATPLYAENGSYYSFYVEQFKQMDQDEQQVRNDIGTYGLTNEFLGQLINVYQQKLNLLKNLQTEINKMNNKVRQKEAPSEKGEVHYLNI